jgi:concanavalin A-like lectin/glucanase superfamily protein
VTGTDIDFPSGPFTLSGWFKTSVARAGKILSKYLSDTNQIYVMTLSNGRVIAGLHDGNDWQEVQTTQTYFDNNWHHFALVVSPTTVQLFIDGVSQGTDTHDNSFPVNNVVWNIGRNANSAQYFLGSIDEIKFYNKALTPAEVISDMNTPLP